jgi:hypothetical protein
MPQKHLKWHPAVDGVKMEEDGVDSDEPDEVDMTRGKKTHVPTEVETKAHETANRPHAAKLDDMVQNRRCGGSSRRRI